MKHDITLPDDIRLLIDTFYEKVKADEQIGYIFNEIARVNWAEHLPHALSGNSCCSKDAYQGNPIQKHF
ncbi:MAG: group III truncated hemoglobin [Saprospiraceae bacterium]|nr:group III truncated hemoglobin [Saprospiraceae bacterium]